MIPSSLRGTAIDPLGPSIINPVHHTLLRSTLVITSMFFMPYRQFQPPVFSSLSVQASDRASSLSSYFFSLSVQIINHAAIVTQPYTSYPQDEPTLLIPTILLYLAVPSAIPSLVVVTPVLKLTLTDEFPPAPIPIGPAVAKAITTCSL